eukprot:CAMPEP_0206432576 /NCGR_PEP_ID=MMETSP0324_2-20121206/8036_1 /ASSEMBLY_ACC=CAM_ASM_000836 /TAXON_ID=2866 /ORGANISM="Crypthecodinium cohnii, Strain Seligo" /LENGTH=58 /DNA_ID=CAMNT_0053898709 /DNA_START=426 /DNA_END=602 /DNA_ORIENTATION=-
MASDVAVASALGQFGLVLLSLPSVLLPKPIQTMDGQQSGVVTALNPLMQTMAPGLSDS